MGRRCEHLKANYNPVGREIEVTAISRVWGTSLGIVIPKRTVERLDLHPGDEIRLLVSRQSDIDARRHRASMPA